MPNLIYDTTAWNKIFRRAFLVEHGLRFPEGVYYEDIPLTVPAHFLARSVDLIEEPVYLWRERQTAEQSITQRRAEVRNLVDRMAAVSSVNDFLERTREVEGKRAARPQGAHARHAAVPRRPPRGRRGVRRHPRAGVPASTSTTSTRPSSPACRPGAAWRTTSSRTASTAELVAAHELQLRDPEADRSIRRGLRLTSTCRTSATTSVGVPEPGLRRDPLAAARDRHP